MRATLREIVLGCRSLLVGMRVTMVEFFKPVVTVPYPHEALRMPERYRGPIELVRDPATGRAICYACQLCARACPSGCITVEGVKREGERRKRVTQYQLDFSLCSLCGACVEACPDAAIRFSKRYNWATPHKEEFLLDLVRQLEQESR
ncbi:MAG: NADH-quinone oxidoreductase subunit I [Verrucomicrobia bacterium]|nr:NADH-quinone oxidoreductase subunit I [Verrucomicrobiota bacterium]